MTTYKFAKDPRKGTIVSCFRCGSTNLNIKPSAAFGGATHVVECKDCEGRAIAIFIDGSHIEKA